MNYGIISRTFTLALTLLFATTLNGSVSEVTNKLEMLYIKLGTLQGNLGSLKDVLTELTTEITRLTTPSNFDSSPYDRMLKKIRMSVEAVRKKMEEAGVAEPDIEKVCGPKPVSTAAPYKPVKPILDPDKNTFEPGKTSSNLSLADELAQAINDKQQKELLLFPEEPLANETIAMYLTRYVKSDKNPASLKGRIIAQLRILNNDYTSTGMDTYNEIADAFIVSENSTDPNEFAAKINSRRGSISDSNDLTIINKPMTNPLTEDMKTATLTTFNTLVETKETAQLAKLAQQEDNARALLTKTSDYLELEEVDTPSSIKDPKLAEKLRKWYDKQINYMTSRRLSDVNTQIEIATNAITTKETELQILINELIKDLTFTPDQSNLSDTVTNPLPLDPKKLESEISNFNTNATNAYSITHKSDGTEFQWGDINIQTPFLIFLKKILNTVPKDHLIASSLTSLKNQTENLNNKKNLGVSKKSLLPLYKKIIKPIVEKINKKNTDTAELENLTTAKKTLDDEKTATLDAIKIDAVNNLAWLLADLFKEKATSAFREATIKEILAIPSDDEILSHAIDDELAKISDFFDKVRLKENAQNKKTSQFNLLVQQYKILLTKFNEKIELLDEKFSNSLGKLVEQNDCAKLVQAIKENNKDSSQPINKNGLPEWLFEKCLSPEIPREEEDIRTLFSRIKDDTLNYDNIAVFWAILYNYKTLKYPHTETTIETTIQPSEEDLEWDPYAKPTIKKEKVGIDDDDLVKIKKELEATGYNTGIMKNNSPKDLFLKIKVNDLINLAQFESIFVNYKKATKKQKTLQAKTPILVEILTEEKERLANEAEALKTENEQKETAATNIQRTFRGFKARKK